MYVEILLYITRVKQKILVKLILPQQQEVKFMPRNNQKVVPEARQALDNMKYEIANQLGVNLKQGYNGDLTAKEAGYVGGYMVKRMIEQAQRQLIGK